MRYSSLLLATLLAIPQSFAQQAPDGVLVPFTSVLPACASQCGPLYDVQGGCSTQACFCADSRLQSIIPAGTVAVSAICGPGSCTTTADLAAIRSWYISFCGSAVSNPTTTTTTTKASAGAGAAATTAPASGSGAATTSGGGGNNSWLATHTRWVIMIVVIIVGLAALWVGGWYFRRRYLRKREREIEMNPPVAWGPNHVRGASGNHPYGDGIVDAGRAAPAGAAGGHHKEMTSALPVSGKRLTKSNMGWFQPHK